MAGKISLIVRKLKFDGSVKSEWEGELLPFAGQEWLVVLHHPQRHKKYADEQVAPSHPLFVHCCNLVRPLSVLLQYALDGRFMEAKCDAALPATRTGDTIEFVDLDLDVVVMPVTPTDLTWYVQDHDDFAARRRSMGYSDHAVQQAHSGIALAKQLVAARHFPFDTRLVPRFDLDSGVA